MTGIWNLTDEDVPTPHTELTVQFSSLLFIHLNAKDVIYASSQLIFNPASTIVLKPRKYVDYGTMSKCKYK